MYAVTKQMKISTKLYVTNSAEHKYPRSFKAAAAFSLWKNKKISLFLIFKGMHLSKILSQFKTGYIIENLITVP